MNPTTAWSVIMKSTALRKPIESYNKPLTDGPKNAPNANVEVHSPDTSPEIKISIKYCLYTL